MSNRMKQLVDFYIDQTRFMKFVRYCQMEGLGSSAAEDDRYYSEQQENFFAEYERQMVTDVYLASLLCEVLDESA